MLGRAAPGPLLATDAVPAFATVEDAQAWYAARYPAPRTLFGTITSWDAIERDLLPAIATLPAFTAAYEGAGIIHADANVDADMDAALRRLQSTPVYAGAARDPDAPLNTLRYLFVHTRCGIWVSIRGGRVALFRPFANSAYRNTWGRRVCMRARVHAGEAVLPDACAWWLNGGIVCNVVPARVWDDGYVAALKDVLDATCAAHAVPDADFFLNKRDFPQLAAAPGVDPYAEFTGEPRLLREAYATHAPVFSFYTGTDMADLPMPTTEDWVTASRRVFPPHGPAPALSPARPTAATERRQVAVFRGAATGRGFTAATNTRVRLAAFSAAHPDVLDAGLTSTGTRRHRVVRADAADGTIVVDNRPPRDAPAFAPVPFMPLQAQVDAFAFIVYADGHCAASRYGTLMHSGAVILRVQSQQPRTSGHLWLFDRLVGATIPAERTESPPADVSGADHLLILPDLSNLRASVEFLRGAPTVAAAVAANAAAAAPTVSSITAYWAAHIRAVHAHTARAQLSPAARLFPWHDRRYARLGRHGAGPQTTTGCVLTEDETARAPTW
jgi:hypothetical protein